MDEYDNQSKSDWSKRYCWAECQEPWKNTLDVLGSLWIDGGLTDAELAVELWSIWTETRFADGLHGDVVRTQIEILGMTMDFASPSELKSSAERREFLDSTKDKHRKDGPSR